VGIIVDDEPRIIVSAPAVTEGNSGTTNAIFTVSLSSSIFITASVEYQTVNGTASALTDYSSRQGFLILSSFQSQVTITVPVIGDTAPEGDETFFVQLSNATGATLADAQGVATIRDDDALPQLVIGTDYKQEGSAGTINVTVPISLTFASGATVTVDYQTSDNTATAPGDYSARQGTLTFAPGVTRATFTIPIVGDTLDENDESFFVNLSKPVHATLSRAQVAINIVDDDAPPSLTIDDASAREGANGAVNATFAVRLSAPSGKNVSVRYQTADGSAKSPADYAARAGTMAFPPGTTQQAIAVPVNADAIAEPNETFSVQLSSAVNATIGDGQGLGTIVDRSAPPRYRSHLPILLRPIPIVRCNDGEPNDTYRDAKPLTSVNQYCAGSLEGEPVNQEADDIYSLDLKAGQQLVVDVLYIPSGANYRLTVWYNTAKNDPIVVGNSDNPGSSNERVVRLIDVAAKYYIRLRKMAEAPSDDAYILHVVVK